MTMEEKNIIAIEIGSSKVRGAIGNYSPSGVLTVQAVEEESMLEWVRYGAVSNIEEVAVLVNRIIRKIENRVSPRKVTSVYIGVGGRSFCSLPREVDMQFAEDVEITDGIIDDLVREAAVSPYCDRELLEVVPREFYVDKKAVNRPKGTVGRSIRMSANLIVCRPSYKRNVDRLFNEKLKIGINGYMVRQLCMGDVVLTSEEKRLGCMLVDFGAETTTVSIYKHGRLQYMSTLPMGSRNITRDIMALNYLEERAEDLKRKVGNACGVSAENASSSNEVDFTEINNYVSHRSGEIIANIHKQLEYAHLSPGELSGGIVVVGGGSRLAGFNDCLAKKMTMRLRVGSVNLAEIRIPDSRISPTDACDVISVLYRAAVEGAQECLTSPEPERIVEEVVSQTYEQQVPESYRLNRTRQQYEYPAYQQSQSQPTVVEPQPRPVEPEPAPVPQPEPPKPKKSKGSGWLASWRDRVAKMMTESEDDSDYLDD